MLLVSPLSLICPMSSFPNFGFILHRVWVLCFVIILVLVGHDPPMNESFHQSFSGIVSEGLVVSSAVVRQVVHRDLVNHDKAHCGTLLNECYVYHDAANPGTLLNEFYVHRDTAHRGTPLLGFPCGESNFPFSSLVMSSDGVLLSDDFPRLINEKNLINLQSILHTFKKFLKQYSFVKVYLNKKDK